MDVYHLRGYRYRHFSARFVNVLCTNSQFVYIMNKQKKKKLHDGYRYEPFFKFIAISLYQPRENKIHILPRHVISSIY